MPSDALCSFAVVRQTALGSGAPLRPAARPSVLFDAVKALNAAMRDAGPPGKLAQRTFDRCGAKLDGCYLGLYRRDETGVRTMEMLRQKGLVPAEASCPIESE